MLIGRTTIVEKAGLVTAPKIGVPCFPLKKRCCQDPAPPAEPPVHSMDLEANGFDLAGVSRARPNEAFGMGRPGILLEPASKNISLLGAWVVRC